MYLLCLFFQQLCFPVPHSRMEKVLGAGVPPLAQCVMGYKARLEEEGKAFPTSLQALCVCTELYVGIREQPPQGTVGKGDVIFKSMLKSLCIDSLGFLQTCMLYLPLIPESCPCDCESHRSFWETREIWFLNLRRYGDLGNPIRSL